MYCSQLISSEISPLGIYDTAGAALRQMEEFMVEFLPVTAEEKYLGLIDKEALLEQPGENNILTLHDSFVKPFVKGSDYFLLAVKQCHTFYVDVMPVVNDKHELEGVVTRDTLFHQLSQLIGVGQHGSLIVLEIENKDYSLGEINRLVESNDAMITQLNTWFDPTSPYHSVVLRINKEEVSDTVTTFQRHGFTVKYFLGEELYRNELQNNLEHLMNYLNI
jgi:acetoin utilization protein AcuB